MRRQGMPLPGNLGITVRDPPCPLQAGAPVVGLNDSGGARIQEGVMSLAGYAEVGGGTAGTAGLAKTVSPLPPAAVGTYCGSQLPPTKVEEPPLSLRTSQPVLPFRCCLRLVPGPALWDPSPHPTLCRRCFSITWMPLASSLSCRW